ncbi:hypothetical protein GLV98_02385 [Halobacillus litoralis]|uniref:Uncharacterized protein n=1 Tax=Halobacillus litoralis TaxID=45668 RepID=A0A845E218_9BACI|nr:hypothetical protein [Halobacillus litoralis]MYL48309.1 hypothetical protein [Halobacillus litoralis]
MNEINISLNQIFDLIINGLLWLLLKVLTGLLWVSLKALNGVIVGLFGFITAMLLYRYLNYRLVDRDEIKGIITSFLLTCSGYRKKGSTHYMPTKQHPGSDYEMPVVYPSTKAITQHVRMTFPLFKFNRWGFKYDEEFIKDLLEDMLFEGCVQHLYDEHTHEIVGWKYGGECLRKLKFSIWRPIKVKRDDSQKVIIISQGKKEEKIYIKNIDKVAKGKRKKYLGIFANRLIDVDCGWNWRATRLKKKIDKLAKVK